MNEHSNILLYVGDWNWELILGVDLKVPDNREYWYTTFNTEIVKNGISYPLVCVFVRGKIIYVSHSIMSIELGVFMDVVRVMNNFCVSCWVNGSSVVELDYPASLISFDIL